MGARKSSKKRVNPDRHKSFMFLRREKTLISFIMKDGNRVFINPLKHFLLGKEYKNPEFKREVVREANRKFMSEQTAK